MSLLRAATILWLAGCLALAVSTASADNPGTAAGSEPATILVKFQPGTSADAQADVHRRHGGVVVDEIRQLGVKVVRVPAGQAAAARAYAGESAVVYAEPTARGEADVSFNGVSAPFSVVSSGLIMATVPTGATSGPITVTTPSGSVASPAPFAVPSG